MTVTLTLLLLDFFVDLPLLLLDLLLLSRVFMVFNTNKLELLHEVIYFSYLIHAQLVFINETPFDDLVLIQFGLNHRDASFRAAALLETIGTVLVTTGV